jgi:hypothetical protein
MVAPTNVLIIKAVSPSPQLFPKLQKEKEYNEYFLRFLIPYTLSYYKLDDHIDYSILTHDFEKNAQKEDSEEARIDDLAVEISLLSEEKENARKRDEKENFIVSSRLFEITYEITKAPKGYYDLYVYSPVEPRAQEVWSVAPDFFFYPGIGGYVKVFESF